MPVGMPQPPEGLDISITANKGIIESVIPTHPALLGLVGKKFDGGIINNYISKSGYGNGIETIEAAGTWIESILGKTTWGR